MGIFLMIGSVALICFLIIKNMGVPLTNWPLAGMLPEILLNLHRLHDKFTEFLDPSGGTFLYRGPCFSGTDMLVTADPLNVHYIMTQNFSNFPKGSKFRQIFEVLGDGIFNSDQESWMNQRKMARLLMNRDGFVRFTRSTNLEKVRTGLLPILDHMSVRGEAFDLQDLFQRFTFDVTSILISGYDPLSLSADLPDIPYIKAMDDVEEALIYRHLVSESMWKLMRWIDIGPEKKLTRGWKELDRIINEYILKKRHQVSKSNDDDDNDDDNCVDMLSSFIRQGLNDNKFLRDVIVNFMTARRDTTSSALSWFFWLLSKNSQAKEKIRKELEVIDFDYARPELTKLVYLHGALCETLRLYPSVPLQHKSPLHPNTLPTGHRVDSESTILFSLYAMGRMRSIWGDDCHDCREFKPERWISEKGGMRHEPSYKFLAFNAGPRTCIGREIAMTQMKMVVAAIFEKYEVEVLKGQKVVPCLSIILHMRNGLMTKVTKKKY